MTLHSTTCRVAICAAALALSACEASKNAPVIFGQAQTVGISIGQNQATQAPEFVLGYKDANIAFLPTVAIGDDGKVVPLGGATEFPSKDGSTKFNETYSVLGQFEVDANAGQSDTGAKIGKFFSTGLAAQKLAAGFACAISDGRDLAHCHPPAAQTN